MWTKQESNEVGDKEKRCAAQKVAMDHVMWVGCIREGGPGSVRVSDRTQTEQAKFKQFLVKLSTIILSIQ